MRLLERADGVEHHSAALRSLAAVVRHPPLLHHATYKERWISMSHARAVCSALVLVGSAAIAQTAREPFKRNTSRTPR